jgi:hypothetical protein
MQSGELFSTAVSRLVHEKFPGMAGSIDVFDKSVDVSVKLSEGHKIRTKYIRHKIHTELSVPDDEWQDACRVTMLSWTHVNHFPDHFMDPMDLHHRRIQHQPLNDIETFIFDAQAGNSPHIFAWVPRSNQASETFAAELESWISQCTPSEAEQLVRRV